MTPTFEFGLSLLTAHFVGDYVLQTDRIATEKHRLPVLLAHCAIHAVVAYVLAGRWSAWPLPLIVFITHGLIDRLKLAVRGARSAALVADQLAHAAVIGGLMWGLAQANDVSYWVSIFDALAWRGWVLASGAILCVRVAGIFIGYWVAPYLKEIDIARGPSSASPTARGLTNGGRVIGQWERALIFLLVGVNQPGAIGFLIAAKSIFRFGELKDRENRMEAEYITIGTLMSFGWATASAYATWWLFARI